MAIDSQAKRQSACFFGKAGRPSTLAPDGTIDQSDRQDAAGFYRGILAVTAVTRLVLQMVYGYVPSVRVSAKAPAVSVKGYVPSVNISAERDES